MDHVTNIFKKFIQVGSSPKDSEQCPRRSLLKAADSPDPHNRISAVTHGLDECKLKYDADASEVVNNRIDINKYEELHETDRELYNDILINFSNGDVSPQLSHKYLSDSQILEQRKLAEQENSVDFKHRSIYSKTLQENVEIDTCPYKLKTLKERSHGNSQNISSSELTEVDLLSQDKENTEDAKSDESPDIYKSAECLDLSSQPIEIGNTDKTEVTNCCDITFTNSSEILRSPNIKFKHSLEPVTPPECLNTSFNQLGITSSAKTELVNNSDIQFNNAAETVVGSPNLDISLKQLGIHGTELLNNSNAKKLPLNISSPKLENKQIDLSSTVVVEQFERNCTPLKQEQFSYQVLQVDPVKDQHVVEQVTEVEISKEKVEEVGQVIEDTFQKVQGHPVDISSVSEYQVQQVGLEEDQLKVPLDEFSQKSENNRQIGLSSTVVVEQVERNCSTLKQEQFSDQVLQVDPVKDQHVVEQVTEVEISKERVEELDQVIEDTFQKVQGHPVDISSVSEYQVQQKGVEEDQLKVPLDEFSQKSENNRQIDLSSTSTVVVEQVERNCSTLQQEQFSDQILQVDPVKDQNVVEQVTEVEISKEKVEEVGQIIEDTFQKVQGYPVDISTVSEYQVQQEGVEEDQLKVPLDEFSQKSENNRQIDLSSTSTVVVEQVEKNCSTLQQEQFSDQVLQVDPVKDQNVVEQVTEVKISKEKVEEVGQIIEDTFQKVQGHPVDISSVSEYQVQQEGVEEDQLKVPLDEFCQKSENNTQIDLSSTVVVEQVERNCGALKQEQFSDQVLQVDSLKDQQSVVAEVTKVEAVHDIEQKNFIEIKEKVHQVIEDSLHKEQGHPVNNIPSFPDHQVKQEAVGDLFEENLKDSVAKQSIILGPTKQETTQSKMGDINDTLNALQQENSDLKLKLNASQQEKASLELEIRQKEEVIIKSQAEALKSEQLFKQELKQLKEQLKENSKFIENDSTKELQEQLKEAKLKEAKLLDELAEKQNLEKVTEKFQSVLKTRMNENIKLKEDLDSAKTHLANLELAFSDLHSKYEKAKESLEGYKKHTAELLINLDTAHQNSKRQEERYESLKTYAKNQIERANRENAADRERFLNENAKQQAIIKRLEIKCGSLEVTLSQKIEECQALSALCDEVTGKKV